MSQSLRPIRFFVPTRTLSEAVSAMPSVEVLP